MKKKKKVSEESTLRIMSGEPLFLVSPVHPLLPAILNASGNTYSYTKATISYSYGDQEGLLPWKARGCLLEVP